MAQHMHSGVRRPAQRSLFADRLARRLERKVVAVGLDAAPAELHALQLLDVVMPTGDGGLSRAHLERLHAAAPGLWLIGSVAAEERGGGKGDWVKAGDHLVGGMVQAVYAW